MSEQAHKEHKEPRRERALQNPKSRKGFKKAYGHLPEESVKGDTRSQREIDAAIQEHKKGRVEFAERLAEEKRRRAAGTFVEEKFPWAKK